MLECRGPPKVEGVQRLELNGAIPSCPATQAPSHPADAPSWPLRSKLQCGTFSLGSTGPLCYGAWVLRSRVSRNKHQTQEGFKQHRQSFIMGLFLLEPEGRQH